MISKEIVMSGFVSNPIFYTEATKDISISKSNTLIEAGFDLTLAEHDLMTLAINKLHKQDTGNHEVFITAQEFAVANKISESHAYQQLKATADKLMERQLKFPLYVDLDKKRNKEPNIVCVVPPKHGRYETVPTKHNWLQSVGYMESNGFIYLLFTDPIRFLIDKTGDAYTTYNFTNTIEMPTFGGKRLYEMVCKWKDLGKTKMMYIDEWKEFFGVADKYPKVFEFKRWVILPAIAEVNAQGDFRISLEQLKVGRTITHFQIIIKKLKTEKKKEEIKTPRDKDTIDMFHRMTESQLDTFSSKLSDLSAVQSMANVGETMPSFKARLRQMLKDPKQQQKLQPYLKQVGFK
jgi:plasmid replication initiation protein